MKKAPLYLVIFILLLSFIGVFFFVWEKNKNSETFLYKSEISLTEKSEAEVTIESKAVEREVIQEKKGKNFLPFDKATVKAKLILEGPGSNIDSPEFWNDSENDRLYLYVSAKGNKLIEIWKFPFLENESDPLNLNDKVNGIDIDSERKWILVGNLTKMQVDVYSLPELSFIKSIGKGKIMSGETNMDILSLKSGKKIIYVSESDAVRGFDADSGDQIYKIKPATDGIEEIMADDYYEIVYIPEEEGVSSKIYQGGAVLAHNPDGTPYQRGGTNVFGTGIFTGDEEGILLYRCKSEEEDDGDGFIVVANQDSGDRNSFEFFNRKNWEYLGSLKIEGVSGTDGIASYDESVSGFPDGIFAATNTDKTTALVGWDEIFEETKLSCGY